MALVNCFDDSVNNVRMHWFAGLMLDNSCNYCTLKIDFVRNNSNDYSLMVAVVVDLRSRDHDFDLVATNRIKIDIC